MKLCFALFLLVAVAVLFLSGLGHFIAAIFSLGAGAIGFSFGVLGSIGATLFGLLISGIATFFGLCLGLIPILIPLAVLALPFLLIALLIRALSAPTRHG